MSDEISSALIREIGEMVLDDPEFEADTWDAISLVATFHDGSEEMSGYMYFADGSFEAAAPFNIGDIVDKFLELREHMEENGQGAFLQSLLHITKPDIALRLQFEHDNPKRWWPEKVSMDMSAFAEQLRPDAG